MKKLLILLLGAIVIFSNVSYASNQNIFTFNIGNFKITSLINKEMEYPQSLFRIDNQIIESSIINQKDARLGALNEFIIDTGTTKILFDTGIDSTVITRLEEINLHPEDIDIIILTHMHPDHIGGLLDNKGRIVFPNAKIFISEEEFEANKNSKIIEEYDEVLEIFEPDTEIIQGIKSAPAFGHTKGHTIFWIENNDQKLLIWADTIHANIQFSNPKIHLTYDEDYKSALEVREQLLQQAAKDNIIVGGMHLSYPGVGMVIESNEDINGYEFVPLAQKQLEEE